MQLGHSRRRSERGQILVIMIVGIVTILIATSVIVDGGNAWAQQRSTENGADAAALVGADRNGREHRGFPEDGERCPLRDHHQWRAERNFLRWRQMFAGSDHSRRVLRRLVRCV